MLSFNTGTATISVHAPFYIADKDKRDLQRAKRVNMCSNRNHFTTVLPFKTQISMVTVA